VITDELLTRLVDSALALRDGPSTEYAAMFEHEVIELCAHLGWSVYERAGDLTRNVHLEPPAHRVTLRRAGQNAVMEIDGELALQTRATDLEWFVRHLCERFNLRFDDPEGSAKGGWVLTHEGHERVTAP
jgi:hypothetical protein